jgi:hypothetical protein
VTARDRYFTPNMDSMGYQGNGSRHKQTDPKGTRVIGGDIQSQRTPSQEMNIQSQRTPSQEMIEGVSIMLSGSHNNGAR